MSAMGKAIERAVAARAELREEELPGLVAEVTGLRGERLALAARTSDDVIVASLGDTETLHARPGGWVVGLGDAAARSALATAITAGVLAVAGFDQLPALVLPAVLPLLVDIDRVELSASDEHLLASLRLQPDVVEQAHSPEQLYELLPADLQAQVSLLDFVDFVSRLVAAGEADEEDAGVVVRDTSDPAWIRVTVS
jgi:hypothetical protein